MLLFLDTEFTCLPNPVMSPRLISIGLVTEDGKHEFYGEIRRGEGWEYTDCSDFVMIEVVPLLKGSEFAMTPTELKARLLAWLNTMPGGLTPATDSYIDLEFLKALLGQDWPASLNREPNDLRPLLAEEESGRIFDRAFIAAQRDRGGSEHNALDDAWGNRAGWMACHASESGEPIPTSGIAEFILDLARRHGVRYVETPTDAFADTLARLAGEEIEMDEIEMLILALERAGVLPSEAVVPLHISYLREKNK